MNEKTDRELLELAARVIGLELVLWHADNSPHAARPGDTVSFLWNPLTDDGDALRLAVALKLQVITSGRNVVQAVELVSEGTPAYGDAPVGDDRFAATRRAIVRAAAAIGEAQQ